MRGRTDDMVVIECLYHLTMALIRHWIMSMVDYDIRLTQWAFSGAIEEQHLGHWDIVGHDSHIQRSQTFRVHTENLFLCQSFPY